MSSLLEAARDLRSLIESSAEANPGQPIPDSTIEALHDAGLIATMIPKAVGGHELGFNDCLDVFAEVAYADGSAGWCTMAASMTASFFGAFCPDSFVDEMFGPGIPIAAGQFAPNGIAVPTDDGYRVSGQFNFGSGIRQATWVGAGAISKVPDGENPAYLFTMMPKDKITVTGNWEVLGLEGTASYDYNLVDVDVPAHATFDFMEFVNRRGGPIYSLGVLPLTSLGHAGWAIGVVRRALDEVAAIAVNKQRMTGSSKMIDDPRFRYDLGVMESRFRAAEAWCRQSFIAAEQHVIEHGVGDPKLNAALSQSTVFLTQEGADIIRQAYLHAGTTALREGPLQRCFRDIHAGSQHAMASPAHTTGFGDTILHP